MTQFNPDNKTSLTYGEVLNPIFKITDPADAKQYKAAYIRWVKDTVSREDLLGKTAEQIVNSNIGYYAGYGSAEDRVRIESLFLCSHPVFGPAKDGIPTNEEVYQNALKIGNKQH